MTACVGSVGMGALGRPVSLSSSPRRRLRSNPPMHSRRRRDLSGCFWTEEPRAMGLAGAPRAVGGRAAGSPFRRRLTSTRPLDITRGDRLPPTPKSSSVSPRDALQNHRNLPPTTRSRRRSIRRPARRRRSHGAKGGSSKATTFGIVTGFPPLLNGGRIGAANSPCRVGIDR